MIAQLQTVGLVVGRGQVSGVFGTCLRVEVEVFLT